MSEENNKDEYALSDMERRLTIAILQNSSNPNSKDVKAQIEALREGYVMDYPLTYISNEKPREKLVKINEILTMFVELKEIVEKFTISETSQWTDVDSENWTNYGTIKQLSLWGSNRGEPWINSYCDFLLKSGRYRTIRKDYDSTLASGSEDTFEIWGNMLQKFHSSSYEGYLGPKEIAYIVNPELKYEKNGRYS